MRLSESSARLSPAARRSGGARRHLAFELCSIQVQGLAAGARRVADELTAGTLGRDFEQRAQHIRDHYARMGDDPFGLDPEFTRYGAMLTAFMHRRYFRTEVHGIENVPAGRALLIANHSGQIPIDGLILALTTVLRRRTRRG